MAKAVHEKEKSNKFGSGISCWIETYMKKIEIYQTKDKVLRVKINRCEGSYTTVNSPLDLVIFCFSPLR